MNAADRARQAAAVDEYDRQHARQARFERLCMLVVLAIPSLLLIALFYW